jgi:ParB-like chromosome segregation protein Spo0J
MLTPIYKIGLHPRRRGLGAIPAPNPECVHHLQAYSGEGVSPLLVQDSGTNGELWLLTGEKWWIAAQSSNTEFLPVQIFDGSDEAALSLLRADFAHHANPIQLAKLAQQIQLGSGDKPLKVAEVARILRMDRSTVAHCLRLLSLVPEIQEKLTDGTLTPGKVKPLVGMPPAVQRKVAERIEGTGWTVRKVEDLAKVIRDPEGYAEKTNNERSVSDPNLLRLERLISEGVGVPAHIKVSGEQGTLVFDFGTLDVLTGLIERLGITLDD